jgi:hypothetical protein
MENHRDIIDVGAAPPAGLVRTGKAGLALGLFGMAACAAGWYADANQFFHSYLTAYMFWLNIALGSLAVAMVQYLTGGVWGFLLRRPLEAASRALPLLALLFAPLLFGIEVLYPWARAAAATDANIQAKAGYLNVPFFVVRAVIYLVAWVAIAWRLNRWSQENDRTGDPDLFVRLQRMAPPSLIIYAVTITFASIDWVMSLEPHWYSTIFGMIFMAGEGLSALAFAALVLIYLSHTPPVATVVRTTSLRDIGNMVLAFVMLWAYTSFSQLLLIWAGNLPDEIPWYLHRIGPGWQVMGIGLALFHFFVPFVLLLMRRSKRALGVFLTVVIILLVMRYVDMFWMIAPETHAGQLRFSWQDLATMAAVGGLFVWVFARQLASRALLPVHDTLEMTAALERE